jgi:hypothetical protein
MPANNHQTTDETGANNWLASVTQGAKPHNQPA